MGAVQPRPGIDYALAMLVFICVFFVYFLSMPRTVVFEDDGLFILAAYFNGIAHSPGYPLFTLLGYLATHVPVGSVALRGHALSALFGAASVVMLYCVAARLFNSRIFAAAAALGYGVSRAFWSQAIITEVYTLNTFFYFVLFWGALYYVRAGTVPSKKFLYLMFFIYGLGLSNHWPLLILSTPAILAVLWPRIREIIRAMPMGMLFLLLGLSPYVWMVVRSRMDPVISFYGPLNSWHDIWFTISRQGYAEMDHQETANYMDKLLFCGFALKESLWQLGPLSGVLAIVGFVRQWKHWPDNLCTGLILAYLGNTFLLSGLLGFKYTLLSQDVFKVYPLIAYSTAVIWTMLGVFEVAVFMKSRFHMDTTLAVVNVVFTAAVAITGMASNLPLNYRVNDRLAENYAKTILQTLEQDAIFFTAGDLDTGPLGYFNLIEKMRPDVTLYNVRSLIFNTRLENPMTLDFDESNKTLSDFIRSQQRPIYYVSSMPAVSGIHDYGAYHQIDKSMEKGEFIVVENSRIKAFYENQLLVDKLYDPWENLLHKLLISDYCRVAVHMHYYENPRDHQGELLRICRGYYGLLAAAGILLGSPAPDLPFISTLLENASHLQDEALNQEDYAKYLHLKATLLDQQGDTRTAMDYYRRAIQLWPSKNNPAYTRVSELQPGTETSQPE